MSQTSIDVMLNETIGTISPNIYGHFVEHLGGVVYNGIWVGEDSDIPNIRGFRRDLIERLRALGPSVIRWPGGCFAETYDWRDGIGPRDQRPVTVNWWYMNDGLLESNHVGTHEFVDFCRLVGAEPYFALNATSGTVLEGRNWIEYCNMPSDTTSLAGLRERNGSREPFEVKYWGLGNENWGGGGAMTPEDYCAVYRKYGIICKSVLPDGYFIACGANESIPEWTEEFFRRYKQMYTVGRIPPLSGYSLHYYVSNFGQLGEESDFTDQKWYETLRQAGDIETFIKTQINMIDAALPGNDLDLILDEWGLWHQYHGRRAMPDRHLFAQANNMRDALVAAVTLNKLNNLCHRVKMANIAQLVNCIQSLFATRDDQLVETTTYHVYDIFKEHRNGQALKTLVKSSTISYQFADQQQTVEAVTCSASLSGDCLNLTLTNASTDSPQELAVNLLGGGMITGQGIMTLLHSGQTSDGNSFAEPDKVRPVSSELAASDGIIRLTMPPASVARVSWALGNV